MRANSKDRAEFYSKLWQIGIMTQNEIRLKEDLNPSPEPFADDLFVPLNMVPLSMLKEQLDKSEPEQIPETMDPDTPEEVTQQAKKVNVYPMNPLKTTKKTVIGGDNENLEQKPVPTEGQIGTA